MRSFLAPISVLALLITLPCAHLPSDVAGPTGVDTGEDGRGTRASTLMVGPNQLYKVIQYAVDNASSGDTIRIYAGGYYENVVVNKTLSIVGNGSTETVIDGTGVGSVVTVTGDHINITDLAVNGGEDYVGGLTIDSDGNTVLNCSFSNNGHAIRITGGSFNRIYNCTARNNQLGINLGGTHNHVRDFTGNSNSFYGINVGGDWNLIENTSCDNNGMAGYYFVYAENNTLSNCTARGHPNGDLVLWMGNTQNDILNCTFTGASKGVYLYSHSDLNLIDNCTVSGNTRGIVLEQVSNGNTVAGCDILDNTGGGVELSLSDHNTFRDSLFATNPDGITVDTAWYTTVTGCIFMENQRGVDMDDSQEGTVSRCGFSGSDDAIYMVNSDDNLIANNSMRGNDQGVVIKDGSGYNTVVMNNITDSTGYAVDVDSTSSWNSIYFNNFVDNNDGGVQARDDATSYWDTGEEGNHWSDWTTPDTEPDGIVDEPYALSGGAGGQDDFPLVDPFGVMRLYVPGGQTAYEDEEFTVRAYARCTPRERVWTLDTNASWLTETDDGLTGTPAQSDIGTYWVDIEVTDGVSVGSDHIEIEVLNVNDAPAILTEDVVNCVEDEPYEVSYEAQDVDPGATVLEWSLATNATFLDMDGETGVLSGMPGNDELGPHWVNVSVADDDGGSDFTNFTLTAWNANDPPHILTADVGTCTEDVLYEVAYEAFDPDPTNDVVTWELTTDAAFLSMDGLEGVLTGTPENDDVGVWEVNVTASDPNGEADTHVFLLAVENVNDAPQINTTPPPACLEEANYTVDFDASDIDPTDDKLAWALDTDAEFLAMDPATGVLHGVPDDPDVGRYDVYVNVSDGNGGYDELEFRLRVDGVNDPPYVDVAPKDITMDEDTVDNSLSLRDWFGDVEGDKLRYSCDCLWENVTVEIMTSNVVLEPLPDWSGEAALRFAANDSKAEVWDIVNVTVEPVNDPPTDPRIDLPQLSYHGGRQQWVVGNASDVDTPYGDVLTFTWSSNVTGRIGKGREIDLSLPPGWHNITLKVEDQEGEKVKAYVELEIEVEEDGDGKEPDGGDIRDQGGDGAGGGSSMWIVAVIVAVIAVVVVFLSLLLKRKRKEGRGDEGVSPPKPVPSGPAFQQMPMVPVGGPKPLGAPTPQLTLPPQPRPKVDAGGMAGGDGIGKMEESIVMSGERGDKGSQREVEGKNGDMGMKEDLECGSIGSAAGDGSVG